MSYGFCKILTKKNKKAFLRVNQSFLKHIYEKDGVKQEKSWEEEKCAYWLEPYNPEKLEGWMKKLPVVENDKKINFEEWDSM